MERDELNKRGKLDELLCIRESRRSGLRTVERLIHEGIKAIGGLPDRWYVRNPGASVISYLQAKHGRPANVVREMAVGYGELHGEFALVPHDVSYAWEITQEEFDYALSVMGETPGPVVP